MKQGLSRRTFLTATGATALAYGQAPANTCIENSPLEYEKTAPKWITNGIPIYTIEAKHFRKIESVYKDHFQKQCGRPYDPLKDNPDAIQQEKIKFIKTVLRKAGDPRSDKQQLEFAHKILKAYASGRPIHWPAPSCNRFFDNEKKIKAAIIIGAPDHFSPGQYHRYLATKASSSNMDWMNNPNGTTEDYLEYFLLHEKYHALGIEGEAEVDFLACRDILDKYPDGSRILFVRAIMQARLIGAIMFYREDEYREKYGLKPYYALKKLLYPEQTHPQITPPEYELIARRVNLSSGYLTLINSISKIPTDISVLWQTDKIRTLTKDLDQAVRESSTPTRKPPEIALHL